MTRPKYKKTIPWLTIGIIYLMLPVSFAGSSATNKTTFQDVQRQMRETAQVLKNYSVAQRDDVAKQVKETLDKLDIEIESMQKALDENADQMKQAARQRARDGLKALRKQRIEVAEWYGKMQQSSANAWQDIKRGFVNSYQSLQESFDKAHKEF